MSDADQTIENEVVEEKVDGVESRRKFLKISVVAGATVAALAAGVNFMPNIASAGKELQSKLNPERTAPPSSDSLILVLKDGRLDAYQGENKYTSNDSSFVKSISSSVRSRM